MRCKNTNFIVVSYIQKQKENKKFLKFSISHF